MRRHPCGLRVLRVVCALTVSVFAQPTAMAGPNAGGTLILALSEGTILTEEPACTITAESCESIVADVTSSDGGFVLNVVAAFHPDASPRLSGVTFGIDYVSGLGFDMVNWSHCGDFELSDPSWPGPGSGTAVTWGIPQTAPLVAVYGFGVYAYAAYGPGLFMLEGHPAQGGEFADDSVPAQVDPIAGYGAFGFYTAGSLSCPTLPGACCDLLDDSCELTTEADCGPVANYQGDGTVCDPDPCSTPTPMACCFSDGSCQMLPREDCVAAGGEPLENYIGTCDPNPCARACCLEGGVCIVLHVVACFEQGGLPVDAVACEPSPCPTPTHDTTWGRTKALRR